MDSAIVVHLTIDILFLVASVVLTASVIWIRTFFRGSVSQRGWRVILVGVIFLLVGGISDIFLMIVMQEMSFWMATIQEVFLSIFLMFLAYGLYSMARAWKNLVEAV
jgi:hypothetical protein